MIGTRESKKAYQKLRRLREELREDLLSKLDHPRVGVGSPPWIGIILVGFATAQSCNGCNTVPLVL